MTFVIRMALREIRASWQRLLFFFICISVGVASIVAIRSVIQSVRAALTSQAQEMTGGDMVVRGNGTFSPLVQQTVEREQRAGRITTVSTAAEIATMVRPGTGRAATRMVELRAVDGVWPLYGTMTLREGTYSHALVEHQSGTSTTIMPSSRSLTGNTGTA